MDGCIRGEGGGGGVAVIAFFSRPRPAVRGVATGAGLEPSCGAALFVRLGGGSFFRSFGVIKSCVGFSGVGRVYICHAVGWFFVGLFFWCRSVRLSRSLLSSSLLLWVFAVFHDVPRFFRLFSFHSFFSVLAVGACCCCCSSCCLSVCATQYLLLSFLLLLFPVHGGRLRERRSGRGYTLPALRFFV